MKILVKEKITKNKVAYLFLAPAIVILIIVLIYPAIQAFVYSFSEWDGIGLKKFIAFDNYKDLIKDKFFWLSLKNSIVYSILSVGGTAILGFFLAVAIERRVKGWAFFKVTWFIPVMMSQTIVATLWTRILDPVYGPLNIILRTLGLEILTKEWLADPKVSIYAAVIVSIWQYTGISMLLLLTAMEGISLEVHDAATLDGVNLWQRIKFIIFPLIKPVLGVVILLNTIFSLKVFDTIWVLTQGGPGYSSSVLAVYLYRVAFRFQSFGYSSTIAVLMFIIIFAVSLIYLRFVKMEAK
ncbi:MAG: hypothetical protein COT09_00855 [Candidatus Hydromicrobium americanum]|nr:MAG: hypothetical protein COT09_00855 [Candidatus Hydromicrobium americanum]